MEVRHRPFIDYYQKRIINQIEVDMKHYKCAIFESTELKVKI